MIKALLKEAYEYLKDKIIHWELEYGKFYSKREIVVDIGFLRTPFKEALVRLSQDRYIDIVLSKGFCLHVLSLQDVINLYQFRVAVEGFCAVLLHMHRNEKEAHIANDTIKRP